MTTTTTTVTTTKTTAPQTERAVTDLEQPKNLEEADQPDHTDELRAPQGARVQQQRGKYSVQRDGGHEIHYKPGPEVLPRDQLPDVVRELSFPSNTIIRVSG